MAVVTMGPRTLGVTLHAQVASFDPVARALGLPLIDWREPKYFTFRRRKRPTGWGWEVGLQVGRLWLNLHGDGLPAPDLKRLGEAREWAVAFAWQHGFEPLERKRQPRRRPAPALRLVRAVLAGEKEGAGL